MSNANCLFAVEVSLSVCIKFRQVVTAISSLLRPNLEKILVGNISEKHSLAIVFSTLV